VTVAAISTNTAPHSPSAVLATPIYGTGRAATISALRLPLIGRDHAVDAAKAARTALASILVTVPAPLRRLPPTPPGRIHR
jgi:hypothetical protein